MLDKNTKSMLNPYAPGGNYGFANSVTPKTVNYEEAMSSNQRFSGIDTVLSKVSVQTEISGQEKFPSRDSLGKPYQGNAGE